MTLSVPSTGVTNAHSGVQYFTCVLEIQTRVLKRAASFLVY